MSRRSGPRIRTIKPEWPQDEAIGSVSREARLLYLGLTSQADDEGRLRGGLPLLRAQIYPYDTDLQLPELERWLDELEPQRLITRYEVDGKPYISLPRWADEQRVDRPTTSRFPEPPANARMSSVPPRDSSRGTDEQSRDIALDHDLDHDRDLELSSAVADEVREDVDRVCTLLADLIERNGSKRPMITKAWRDHARLMLDKDGRHLEEVLRVVEWSQKDGFWRSNILSLPKLREKYDQLRLRMTGAANGNGSGSPTASPRLAEKFGGLTTNGGVR